MKLNGIFGKGTGKVGSSVFAISGGEQIVRQYNPQVSNPSTDAQVAQRAKLKLMSQLAAALDPAIVMKKEGLVSRRNKFVSKNIELCSYEDNQASCELTSLQLTDYEHFFPNLEIAQDNSTQFTMQLASAAPEEITKVVYAVCLITSDKKLQLLDVNIVDAGADGLATKTHAGEVNSTYLVLAFGIDTSKSKNAIKYSSYEANANSEDATLDVADILRVIGNVYTKTNGQTLTMAGQH